MSPLPWRFLLFLAVLVLGLTAILAFQLLPSRWQPAEGLISPQTLKAPKEVVFLSRVRTEEKQRALLAGVSEVWVFKPEIGERQLEKLSALEGAVTALLHTPQTEPEAKAQALQRLEVKLSPKAINLILGFQDEQWREVVQEAKRLLGSAFNRRFTASELASIRELMVEGLNPNRSAGQAAVITELVQALIAPNTVVDEAATSRARAAALEKIEPVTVVVEKGETVLRDGEKIDAFALEKLSALGMLDAPFQWSAVLGVGLLVVVLAPILGGYIYLFQPQLRDNPRRLLLLLFLILGTMLAAKLVIPGRDMYALLFPLAATPMLLGTLLDVPLALLVAGLLAILVPYSVVGSLTIPPLPLATLYLVGSLVGVVSLWRAERMYRFFMAGAGVGLANVGVILAFWLVEQDYELWRLGFYAFAALSSGLLSAMVTVGSFVLLGLLFGVTTTWHLLELAQPSHPLLRRLITEAPGTYHHSLIVANLAERAAEAIGADALLARVGAYYHDVGKLINPGYFVENQLDQNNIHHWLPPEVSARMVKSHVSDGLALAKQYRVPARVRDFIPEHHGTRLATYFYRLAAQEQPEVDPELFRYRGPKPQSKETAIVLLADSTEATLRSSPDHSSEVIEELVERTVASRLAEGQLDECPLTLRDLERIKGVFKAVLGGVYHPRIEYPEAPEPSREVLVQRSAPRRQAGEAPPHPDAALSQVAHETPQGSAGLQD